MSDYCVVPPAEVEQWEAEIALGMLSKDLLDALDEAEKAAQALSLYQSRAQELRKAVSAYRARLGLPDPFIPARDPADQARRGSDLLSRAIPVDQLCAGGSPEGPEEVSRDD